MIDQDVAVIVAGAGARGAYEAGALSALLPVLEARGQRPRILLGTSAGAINALLLASFAHLPANEAADALVERWGRADRGNVMRRLMPSVPQLLLRAASEFTGVGWPGLTAVLDPAPLRHTVADPGWLDWDRLHANVRAGLVRAVGVVTTRRADGRTVVFLEQHAGGRVPQADEERGIRYVATMLDARHLVASTAIPVVFPPVLIDDDPTNADWYLDGGVRLNVPIKPALSLGARRLVIVATDRVARPGGGNLHRRLRAPHLAEAAAHVMHATLVDRMIEDVRKLVRINRLVAAAQDAGVPVRTFDGRTYELVEFTFVGPTDDRAIANRADRVLHAKYGGWRSWLPSDFAVIRRLLGVGADGALDLMSYLFFDRDYMRDLVELGRSDAEQMLARKSNPWRVTHMPGTPHRHAVDVPSSYVV